VTSLGLSTSVPDLHPDPYVFGHPGSAFVIQMCGSEDPHPDPYQDVTDPQHCCIELLSLTHI
jgi:hypothetical protein